MVSMLYLTDWVEAAFQLYAYGLYFNGINFLWYIKPPGLEADRLLTNTFQHFMKNFFNIEKGSP